MPLSEKQNMYLALAWQCFDAEPKIDYQKFADLAGLASAASARELMRVTKNKLKTEYGSLSTGLQDKNANGSPVATPKKKTATPRKRKVVAEEGEGDEDGEVVKPKVKKAKKGGKAVAEEDGDGEVAVKAELVEEDEFF